MTVKVHLFEDRSIDIEQTKRFSGMTDIATHSYTRTEAKAIWKALKKVFDK